MVKGEITALLGENGAGKTTTMSMLCGLFPATDGQMEVEGRDVAQNQDYMHNQLGVCPQHDVLWQTLSVRSSSTPVPVSLREAIWHHNVPCLTEYITTGIGASLPLWTVEGGKCRGP